MTSKSRKIRILIPIRYPVGGIRTYLKYTYGKLDTSKYELDFVAPSKEWLNRIKADLGNFHVITHPIENDSSNLAMLYSIFTLLRSRSYQIIHSQGYTAGILSNIANIIYRVPHIVTLHHIFGHGQFSDTFWKHFKMIKKVAIQFILTRSNVIQAVSGDAMENLVEYFPGLTKYQNKLVTIVNGIDVEKFIGNDESPETPFKKEKGVFYVGFIGRYMPEKGFHYLIEAMDLLVNVRKINNVRIVSAGGFGGFIREYKKEIVERNLGNYFIFLDYFENVRPLLKAVDILAIPSLGEACGLAAMEGLVCGLPVIAFRCIGLREVLENTPAILMTTGNVVELTDCIDYTRRKYKIIKQMAFQYVEEAGKRFDSKKTAAKLEKLINSMIK